MITIKAGDREIELYSSVKELPIKRYKLMQQYLLQESGIGSTISDLDQHLSKTVQFVAAGKTDDAKQELSNMRYNFFSLLTGLNFRSKAFACLVKDMEVDRAMEVIDQMSEGEVSETWESVKKNLILNSAPTSPDGSELTLSMLTT